jgi:7,8-dihydroneopterin aldolase/epimerase/oxygenase
MTDHVTALTGMVPDRLLPRTARILLDSLEVQADIGFHDFEIGVKQRLVVTVEVWLEELPGADHDDPDRAWNYDRLRSLVEELASERRYNLQETLANAIYARVAAMRGVKALRVSTAKPDIYSNARGVGVEIASF